MRPLLAPRRAAFALAAVALAAIAAPALARPAARESSREGAREAGRPARAPARPAPRGEPPTGSLGRATSPFGPPSPTAGPAALRGPADNFSNFGGPSTGGGGGSR